VILEADLYIRDPLVSKIAFIFALFRCQRSLFYFKFVTEILTISAVEISSGFAKRVCVNFHGGELEN
jgi:hypothetical protein